VALIDSLSMEAGSAEWPDFTTPDKRRLGRDGAGFDWLQSTELQEIFWYWTRIRGGNVLPSRSDFDPLDLRGALGWITLVDRNADAGEFRYRLVGTRVSELTGIDLTGQSVSAMPLGGYSDFLVGRMWEAVDRARPIACRYALDLRQRRVLVERVDLPLTKGSDRVEFILTGILPLARSKAVLETQIERRYA
jgi:hypothetical protein